MTITRPRRLALGSRVVLATALVTTLQTAGAAPRRAQVAPHVAGEVLVKFKDGVPAATIEAIARTRGARASEPLLKPAPHGRPGVAHALRNLRLVQLPPGVSVPATAAFFRIHPLVEYAEPNYIVSKGDDLFDGLWGLDNTGQTGGMPDADIDAPDAWRAGASGAGVVVAVIDTGVDYNHPDLSANIWLNPGEIEGNGIDDDGNGFVDDIRGWDFFNNDNDPMDADDHGTHVAGTIAAVDEVAGGSSQTGVKGVAFGARIMPLRFLGPSGGSTADAIKAIDYAVANGARIINNSWGGGDFQQSLKDAIDAASDAGAVFVAASGNDGINTDSSPHYPSSYDVDNVIAVAATDHTDTLATFSNYGRRTVDLGAPGVSILSTVPRERYAYLSGTGMAAPHVAGVAALIQELAPELTPAQLREVLFFTTDEMPSTAVTTKAGGRLNAATAVALVRDASFARPAIRTRPRDGFVVGPGESFLFEALVYPRDTVYVTATIGGITTVLEDAGNGSLGDFVYGAALTAPRTAGKFEIAVDAANAGRATVSGRVVLPYMAEETVHEFFDIRSGGAAHTLGDDSSVAVPLGFAFDFLGRDYTSIFINANGNLTFGYGNTAYTNEDLSTTSLANMIAPWWDDLSPNRAGTIYTRTDGPDGARRFIASYLDVAHYNLPPPRLITFQVVLYEQNRDIVFNYLDANFGHSTYDNGRSATVGVKGGPVTQWSFNRRSLHDGLSLRFSLPAPEDDREDER